MKLDNFLIVSIIIAILWTLVKTVPFRKCLAKHPEKATKILNDGAESSVNPQNQKYKGILKSKLNNTNKDSVRNEDKLFKKCKYNKEYYQKNKEYFQNYKKLNKEKIKADKHNYYEKNKEAKLYAKSERNKLYYEKNRERILESKNIYNKNNKEKVNAYQRKYRLKMKNVQSDNNEGTSSVNPQAGDFINKGKLPIVCEKSFEEGNLSNQGDEVCNADDEQSRIEAEEPNKIPEYDAVDLNKEIHPFDLNKKPVDEEWDDY
ncbi:unnamed protein product [Meloidogyne enterolobii]|uniref:Uncharacterized protein n=1 Tax=Meloidogyne enterolobii TaxID=390850 RepID=A0ACB0YC49_MELEN